MLNAMYERGFNAGYRQGAMSGLHGGIAKKVMQRDLIFIYGTLAIALVEKHHWKQDSVENLLTEIQREWMEIGSGAELSNESMAEMVERRTGIHLEQLADDIIEM